MKTTLSIMGGALVAAMIVGAILKVFHLGSEWDIPVMVILFMIGLSLLIYGLIPRKGNAHPIQLITPTGVIDIRVSLWKRFKNWWNIN